jgi:hypothetical protein
VVKAPRHVSTDYSRHESDSALANTLSLDELRKYFHLPIVEVARQLGTCTTALKKVCRRYKIQKWPYRQIRSLTKSIQSLEMAGVNESVTDDLKQQYREQIVTLQKAIDDIVFDPNTNISDLVKKLETEWGANPMGDDKWQSGTEPSENVKQLLQAAAAANAESSSRSSQSASTKRKFSQVEGDKLEAETAASPPGEATSDPTTTDPSVVAEATGGSSYLYPQAQLTSPPKPPVEMVSIGMTQVSHVTLSGSDSKSGTIHFVGPVVLAPLERRRITKHASKKLVPLIEPDICNHFKMEFLPQGTILEVNYFRTFPSGSTEADNMIHQQEQVGHQQAVSFDPNGQGQGAYHSNNGPNSVAEVV